MWQENTHSYTNDMRQQVRLSFRPTDSSDWKYEDRVYKRIFAVKLAMNGGNQFFWYCFAEHEFPTAKTCEQFLLAEQLPFEPLLPFLQRDISIGLDLGAVFPHVAFGVLVFGRAH